MEIIGRAKRRVSRSPVSVWGERAWRPSRSEDVPGGVACGQLQQRGVSPTSASDYQETLILSR